MCRQQVARQNYNLQATKNILWKSGEVHIFWNDSKKSKLHVWRNYGQNETKEWLLPYDPESFVFPPYT